MTEPDGALMKWQHIASWAVFIGALCVSATRTSASDLGLTSQQIAVLNVVVTVLAGLQAVLPSVRAHQRGRQHD